VRVELDAEHVHNGLRIARRAHTNAQHDEIEFFLLHSVIGRGVSNRDILCFRVLFSYRYVASYESNSGEILCSLVESLEVLAIGPNVVVEYRTFGLSVMVLGQDHLLLDVGAANRGAVAVAALNDLPGTDAVNPGDSVRMRVIGGAQYLTFVRPRGA
jgi:hypothetical protein